MSNIIYTKQGIKNKPINLDQVIAFSCKGSIISFGTESDVYRWEFHGFKDAQLVYEEILNACCREVG